RHALPQPGDRRRGDGSSRSEQPAPGPPRTLPSDPRVVMKQTISQTRDWRSGFPVREQEAGHSAHDVVIVGLFAVLTCILIPVTTRGGTAGSPGDEGKQSRPTASPPVPSPEVTGILAKHCLACHGENVRKSGLDLRDLPAMLRGGESGEPAIVPGKAGESRML